jgi:nucleoside-diphosphate-sugar epimerase
MNAPRSAIYNCGSGEAISFNEVIAELNNNLKTKLEPDYFENPYSSFYQAHTEADMTLAKNELGYTPQFRPSNGIAHYISILEGRSG